MWAVFDQTFGGPRDPTPTRIGQVFEIAVGHLLGQWLNFKLFGITYLVGKIKFKLFSQGPLAK